MSNLIQVSDTLRFGQMSMPRRYEISFPMDVKGRLIWAGIVTKKAYKKSVIKDFWNVLSSPVD